MNGGKFKLVSYVILLMQLIGCTEPFIIETIDFENLLVVEGSISNEMKHQVINISRTITLEDFKPSYEINATVQVTGNNGSSYNFSQDDQTGSYISDQLFMAESDTKYTLRITTQDGNDYISTESSLLPPVEISDLYAELTDESGTEGIHVFLDTYDPNGMTNFFRYEFEETYKIRVPKHSSWSWEFVNYDSLYDLYDVILTRRTPEIFCYSSNNSSGIIQASTNNLNENNVVRLPIHFIFKDDSILRERYSILVKQYVQSPEAHTFYKITEDLGNSESKLSQSQPGFVNGNITSTSNPNEKVIGFFDVSSVTSKRIYFNYFDFDLSFPPYFTTCNELILYGNTQLKNLLEQDNYQIQEYITGGGDPITRYRIFKDICTDCTTFSSNIKPDFWED